MPPTGPRGVGTAMAKKTREKETEEKRKDGGLTAFFSRGRNRSERDAEKGNKEKKDEKELSIRVKDYKRPGVMRTVTFSRTTSAAAATAANAVGEENEEFQMALDREDELEVLMEDSLDVLLGEKSDRSPGFGDRNQPHVRRTKTHPAATMNANTYNTSSDDTYKKYKKEFERSKSQTHNQHLDTFANSFADDGDEYRNNTIIKKTQTKKSRYVLPNPENTWYPSLDVVKKSFRNVLNEVTKRVLKTDTQLGLRSSGVRKKQVRWTMNLAKIEARRRHRDANIREDDRTWVRGTRFFEFSQTRLFTTWIATMVFLYVLTEGIDNWAGIATMTKVGGWRLALFNAIQLIINITFLIEAIVKIGGAGPVVRVTHKETNYDDVLEEEIEKITVKYRLAKWEPWSYFFNLSNIYDFTVNVLIIYGYCMDAVPGANVGWFTPGRITAFRLLRMIRVLKFFYSFQQFSVILSGIAAGIKGMGWVVILLLVVMYVYAVLGVTSFALIDPMHFRDLHTSFLTAANVATMNDWRTYLLTTMYGCEHFGYTEDDHMDKCPYLLDDDGETKQYARGHPIVAGMYFISMILIIGNIMMSLVIGIITAKMDEANDRVDELRHERKQKFASKTIGAIWKSRKSLDDSLSLYEYNKVMSYLHLFSGIMDDKEKDQFGTPDTRMEQIQSWMARNIVDTKWFEMIIMLAIVVSACISGYATQFVGYTDDHTMEKDVPDWILDVETSFIYLFLLEILIKFTVYWDPPVMTFFTGRQKYWNIFDLVTVLVGLAGEIAERAFEKARRLASFTRIVRALRLARLVKVMRMVPQLNIIIQSLWLGMLSLIYVLVLMGFVFYAYSVIGVVLFSVNDPFNFRTVPVSSVTLFQVSMLEDWTAVLWVNMMGCDTDEFGIKDDGFYYHNLQEMEEEPPYPCKNPKANQFTAFVYFFTFVIINALVFVSVFIGVIVNGMQEATASMISQINVKRRTDAIREHFEVGIQKLHDLQNTFHLMNWKGRVKMKLSHVEEILTKMQVEHKPGYLRRVIQLWSTQSRYSVLSKRATKTRGSNKMPKYSMKDGHLKKIESMRGSSRGDKLMPTSPRQTDSNAVRRRDHISFSEGLEEQIHDEDARSSSKIAIDFPDFMLLICLLEQAEFLEKSYAEHPNSGKDNWESDSSSVTNSSESESESESEMQHDDQEQEFRRKLELKKAESVRMRLKSYQLGKKGTLDASKFRRNIDASFGATSRFFRKVKLFAKTVRIRAESRFFNVQEKLFEGSNRVIGEIQV